MKNFKNVFYAKSRPISGEYFLCPGIIYKKGSFLKGTPFFRLSPAVFRILRHQISTLISAAEEQELNIASNSSWPIFSFSIRRALQA